METWTAHELHRLVAAFLEVRFPTVVALNKCDRPRARAHVDALLASAETFDESALVPVSAATEAFLVRERARGAASYADGAATFSTAAPSAEADAARAYLGAWGGRTGTLEAVSAAVAAAGPTFAFPVADLDSLRGALSGSPGNVLEDCLLLRPGATVEDAYLAVHKRGHAGDYVRADAVSDDGARRRQAKRTEAIGPDCRVLRISTNKKAPWQRAHRAEAAAAALS